MGCGLSRDKPGRPPAGAGAGSRAGAGGLGAAGSASRDSAGEQLPDRGLLTDGEYEALRETFQRLCAPGQSALDVNTFRLACGIRSAYLAARFFRLIDAKRDDQLDFDELVSAVSLAVHGTLGDRLRVLFHLYDYDDDGFISAEDLEHVLASVAHAADPETLSSGQLPPIRLLSTPMDPAASASSDTEPDAAEPEGAREGDAEDDDGAAGEGEGEGEEEREEAEPEPEPTRPDDAGEATTEEYAPASGSDDRPADAATADNDCDGYVQLEAADEDDPNALSVPPRVAETDAELLVVASLLVSRGTRAKAIAALCAGQLHETARQRVVKKFFGRAEKVFATEVSPGVAFDDTPRTIVAHLSPERARSTAAADAADAAITATFPVGMEPFGGPALRQGPPPDGTDLNQPAPCLLDGKLTPAGFMWWAAHNVPICVEYLRILKPLVGMGPADIAKRVADAVGTMLTEMTELVDGQPPWSRLQPKEAAFLAKHRAAFVLLGSQRELLTALEVGDCDASLCQFLVSDETAVRLRTSLKRTGHQYRRVGSAADALAAQFVLNTPLVLIKTTCFECYADEAGTGKGPLGDPPRHPAASSRLMQFFREERHKAQGGGKPAGTPAKPSRHMIKSMSMTDHARLTANAGEGGAVAASPPQAQQLGQSPDRTRSSVIQRPTARPLPQSRSRDDISDTRSMFEIAGNDIRGARRSRRRARGNRSLPPSRVAPMDGGDAVSELSRELLDVSLGSAGHGRPRHRRQHDPRRPQTAMSYVG